LGEKGLISNTTANISWISSIAASPGVQAKSSANKNNISGIPSTSYQQGQGSGPLLSTMANTTGTLKNKESTFFFVASDNQSKLLLWSSLRVMT
jgi:hypothetical protein